MPSDVHSSPTDPSMQRPARAVHYATSTPNIASTQQSLPGAVYITQESTQLIELGEELPGDEVPEPVYMAMTDQPPEPLLQSTATAAEGTETADDIDHDHDDDEYITVKGTLQVEGRLKITSRGTSTNHATPAASSSHNTAARKALQQLQIISPKSTVTATASTSSQAAISKSAAATAPAPITRDDGKTEYDLTSLFGSKLILGEEAPTKRQRSSPATATPTTSAAFAAAPASTPAALSTAESKPSSDEEFAGFVMTMDAESGEDVYPVFQLEHMSESSDENAYKVSHGRAQLEECPSLLPDSGAVENLVGSNTAKRLADYSRQQGHQPRWVRLHRPKAISGVGGAASASTHQIIVELNLKGGLKLKYCAPVVTGNSSNIPALLGLKEMSRAQMMIHPTQTAAYILPSTSAKPQLPHGSITIPLTLSPSGHQLLAVDTAKRAFITTETTQRQQRPEDEGNDNEDEEDDHSSNHRQSAAATASSNLRQSAAATASSNLRQSAAASSAATASSNLRQSAAASSALTASINLRQSAAASSALTASSNHRQSVAAPSAPTAPSNHAQSSATSPATSSTTNDYAQVTEVLPTIAEEA
eukprot:6490904-Amphidinium_carterae.1